MQETAYFCEQMWPGPYVAAMTLLWYSLVVFFRYVMQYFIFNAIFFFTAGGLRKSHLSHTLCIKIEQIADRRCAQRGKSNALYSRVEGKFHRLWVHSRWRLNCWRANECASFHVRPLLPSARLRGPAGWATVRTRAAYLGRWRVSSYTLQAQTPVITSAFRATRNEKTHSWDLPCSLLQHAMGALAGKWPAALRKWMQGERLLLTFQILWCFCILQ